MCSQTAWGSHVLKYRRFSDQAGYFDECVRVLHALLLLINC